MGKSPLPARIRPVLLAGALLVLGIGSAAAASDACDDLWYRRNAIFKEAGYCFRTARAIRAFGNAGCAYDDAADVPLSARQNAEVGRIRAAERAMGCPTGP